VDKVVVAARESSDLLDRDTEVVFKELLDEFTL